jgi:tetratricopeptide (TPR) repeat protein
VRAQGRSPATLTAVHEATVVRRSLQGPAVAPVVRGLPLDNGYVVRTNPNGMAEALFRDGRHVKLAQNTALEISPARADRMRVLQGKVWVRVPPHTGLEVDGLAARCHITGTELQVEVADDGATTLTVVEGEVRFDNPQGQVVVREAQQSVARPGQAPSPPVTAANLPVLLEWTNDIQPVVLLLETSYVSQDPARLTTALREAEALPPGPARSQRLGDVRHDRGELTAALDAYQQAQTALAPGVSAAERATLAARLGQTWLELGKLPQAEAAFRQSLDLNPSQTAARAGLVMALLSQRQNEAALTTAREAVAQSPNAAVAHTVLALALIRSGQRDAAQQELTQALTLDPGYAQAHAWQSFLLRAAERLDEAGREAQLAVRAAPFSSLARQAQADAQFALGRNQEAARSAAQAVALNPLSPGAHVSLGRALLQAGNSEGALREATKAVALDPNLERARYFRGVALAERRKVAQAVRELQQAIRMDPGYLEARAFLARVYLTQGRRSEATAVVQEALQRNPQFAPAHAAMGRVYWRSGRLREAAAEYRRALELAPGSALYHLELARVNLDQNDLPGALAHALAAVAAAPTASEAHAVLGLVYDRQENEEQAIREYREAISLSPDDSLARLGLATAFPPRSRELAGSGRDRERERAQALLRDPAVLQEIFEPGVTTEILGGGGGPGADTEQLTHRGQFALGLVNDLTVASHSADEGDRSNGWTGRRLLQTDVAAQATPDTQLVLQASGEKNSGGLPASVQQPDLDSSFSRRQYSYGLPVRQYLGSNTYMWLRYGVRAIRVSRDDPDAPPQPWFLGLPDVGLYHAFQQANERVAELRLDHQLGRHLLTYGLADLRNNQRLLDASYELPADPDLGVDGLRPALQDQLGADMHDFLQYLQDDFHLGGRGSMIAGAQLLRLRELDTRRNLSWLVGRPGSPPLVQQLLNLRVREQDWLPYLVFTYPLDGRNLVRVLGNKSLLRPSSPLLAPSEAFIVGEPISIYFTGGQTNGRAETYELDYEHRFSARTFSKLFWEYSRAQDFSIAPTLEQQLIPLGVVVPQVRVQIAGLRLEHQLNGYLSAFARWSYWTVEDRTATRPSATGQVAPNPAQGLEVPFEPHWRGLTGLNYVDRSGLKASLLASLLGRQFTDVTTFGSPDFNRRGKRPAIGPHLLFDLRITREPTVRMEYGLTISNLFNTTYQDVLPGLLTRGRTWLVTLALRF